MRTRSQAKRPAEYKKGPDADEGQHRREDELMKLRGKAKAAALTNRRAQVPAADIAAPHSLRNKAASVLTAPIQSLESSAAPATHAQDSNETLTDLEFKQLLNSKIDEDPYVDVYPFILDYIQKATPKFPKRRGVVTANPSSSSSTLNVTTTLQPSSTTAPKSTLKSHDKEAPSTRITRSKVQSSMNQRKVPTSASSLPDAGFCLNFSSTSMELLHDEDTIVMENVNRDIVEEPVLMPELSAPPSTSWGNAFGRIPEGGWNCQSCHIHNAEIAQQCASCATSRVV